jgi:hypothetical protein
MESSKWTNDTPNKRKRFKMKTVSFQILEQSRKEVYRQVREPLYNQLIIQVYRETVKNISI